MTAFMTREQVRQMLRDAKTDEERLTIKRNYFQLLYGPTAIPKEMNEPKNIDIGRITHDHIAIGYSDGTMTIIQENRETIYGEDKINIPVSALLYAIQEFQKVYPIKLKAHNWKGMYGHDGGDGEDKGNNNKA